jgi:hypothetical protein
MASVRIVGARSASQVLLYMLVGFFAWFISKRIFFNESKVRIIFQLALAMHFVYGLCIPWRKYSADILDNYSYVHLLSQGVAGHLKVIHPWTPESDSQVDRQES